MSDRAPNDDDDLLLFDVIELIKAYEEGLFGRMKDNPPDEVILTGYQSPLTAMESTLELSLVSMDSSMEEIVKSLGPKLETKKQSLEVGFVENETKKPEWGGDREDYHYSKCSYTDKDGNATDEFVDVQDGVLTKNLDFLGDAPLGYDYRKRFTNEYNWKIGAATTKWIEDNAPKLKIGDKTYKLDLENCLDCMIDINVELVLPSIEFVFNINKLLNQIKRLLNEMMQAMDPTLIFNALCRFLANFGANFMCPSNLVGLNLLLPTLFIKYSLDLAKIRFDWTGLFGAMVKSVLDFLVQMAEAFPRVVNPYIDCIINAFRAVMNALRAIVASAEKLTNESINAINQVGYALQKITPSGLFDSYSEDLQQEYDDLKEEIAEKQAAQESILSENSNFNGSEEVNKFVSWLTIYAPRVRLTTDEIKDLLEWYLTLQGNEQLNMVFSALNERSILDKESAGLKKSYKDKIERAKAKERIEENKDYFNLDFVGETKSITTPWFSKPPKAQKRMNLDVDGTGLDYFLSARDVSPQKSDWNALDYAFAKYGLDIKNEYRQPKDLIDYRSKGWVKALNETDTFQGIEKKIIGNLIFAKKWLNEEVAKVVQTLKALQSFMGEVVESEFKLLGEMQALAHLIRFIRLLWMIFDEDITCENAKKDSEVIASIINQNNQNLVAENGSDSLNYDGRVLEPNDYIKVKSLDNNFVTIVDLTQCSELDAALKVNKTNLDDIYEGILNGLSS